MTTVTRSHHILVHVPLQTAFDYVSDLTRHPEWSGGELTIREITPGPVSIGKEYKSFGEVAVQKNRPNTVRISQYEPPHKFGFVAQDPDFGDVSHEFSFTVQDGGTLITRTMTIRLHPIMAILFHFLIYPLIGEPSMDKAMLALRKRLENDLR